MDQPGGAPIACEWCRGHVYEHSALPSANANVRGLQGLEI